MNKYDTFAKTIYLVKLAQDPKVFPRDKDGGEDVVLTFCDNTRIDGTEDLWVDARVARFQAERAKKYRKGDEVQVEGKLRFKRNNEGGLRGKIYDAQVSSFAKLSERTAGAGPVEAPAAEADSRPAFE
jgi:single-stranded DNA-binding protein